MPQFEGIITGPQCGELLIPLADFLDTTRAFNCDYLEIGPDTSGQPQALLELATPEPGLYRSQPVRQNLAVGAIVCKYYSSATKPPEDRPPASRAVLALASIVRALPSSLSIANARGYFLDGIVPWAPRIELNCMGEKAAADDFNTFATGWPRQTNSHGAIEILTDFRNHLDHRIIVATSFTEQNR